jgi:Response regulator with putative antiterminator output domain
MKADRHSYCALIVSKSEKTHEALAGILGQCQFSSVLYADSAGMARRMTADLKIDLVVINTPLPDDFGTLLAMDLSDKGIGVILFVKRDIYEQVSYKTEDAGVVTLTKPADRTALVQSLNMIKAMRRKMAALQEKSDTLEKKMKEIRLVNRAKWILIAQMKMSEEEAHKYIEKTAMDECVTRGEIAERIIRTYET